MKKRFTIKASADLTDDQAQMFVDLSQFAADDIAEIEKDYGKKLSPRGWGQVMDYTEEIILHPEWIEEHVGKGLDSMKAHLDAVICDIYEDDTGITGIYESTDIKCADSLNLDALRHMPQYIKFYAYDASGADVTTDRLDFPADVEDIKRVVFNLFDSNPDVYAVETFIVVGDGRKVEEEHQSSTFTRKSIEKYRNSDFDVVESAKSIKCASLKRGGTMNKRKFVIKASKADDKFYTTKFPTVKPGEVKVAPQRGNYTVFIGLSDGTIAYQWCESKVAAQREAKYARDVVKKYGSDASYWAAEGYKIWNPKANSSTSPKRKSAVMAAKGKTLATAPTEDALVRLINEYYYSKNYEIRDGRVYNSKLDKYMDDVAVEQKKGKWIFKRIEASTSTKRRFTIKASRSAKRRAIKAASGVAFHLYGYDKDGADVDTNYTRSANGIDNAVDKLFAYDEVDTVDIYRDGMSGEGDYVGTITRAEFDRDASARVRELLDKNDIESAKSIKCAAVRASAWDEYTMTIIQPSGKTTTITDEVGDFDMLPRSQMTWYSDGTRFEVTNSAGETKVFEKVATDDAFRGHADLVEVDASASIICSDNSDLTVDLSDLELGEPYYEYRDDDPENPDKWVLVIGKNPAEQKNYKLWYYVEDPDTDLTTIDLSTPDHIDLDEMSTMDDYDEIQLAEDIKCAGDPITDRFMVDLMYQSDGGYAADRYFDDWSDVEAFAHDGLMRGLFARIWDKQTGETITISPDEYHEAWDNGAADFDINDEIVEFKQRIVNSSTDITAARRDTTIDKEAVRELVLYITNDGDLYRQQATPMIENLKRKVKKGVYDKEKAVKLWQYLADAGVKKYGMEFGPGASVAWLNPATREEIARKLRDYYEEEVMWEQNHPVEASTYMIVPGFGQSPVDTTLDAQLSYYGYSTIDEFARANGIGDPATAKQILLERYAEDTGSGVGGWVGKDFEDLYYDYDNFGDGETGFTDDTPYL